MRLSEHLSLAEVIISDTAKRNGISNIPTAEHLESLKILAEEIFEPIRIYFNVPIYISSGYRSLELNTFINGSESSQHCRGEAIDIDMDGSDDGVTNVDVFYHIKDILSFDQLIWEGGTDISPDWVHVSYNPFKEQRNQILRMVKVNGKPIYSPYKSL